MERRVIAAFDFDGTITRKDTFVEFIRYAKGMSALLFGFLIYSPFIVAFKLGAYPAWKAKQRLFGHFFRGMRYDDFCRLGAGFAGRIDRILYPSALEAIRRHVERGDKVYVVTASIEEWVRPWCEKLGIRVIATRAERDGDGKMTGRFSTPNCNGQEKVVRLLKEEPLRDTYVLYAYGDSRGDKELIDFSDKGWYNRFGRS